MKLLVPPGKETLFKFYRLQLLSDGFPGATPKGQENADVQAHPLYGVYLIRMSLKTYEETGDREFLKQAMRVGYAALVRMSTFDDALVFWYRGDSAFNKQGFDYYSALTQAKYSSAFLLLYKFTGDLIFKTSAEKVIKSLAIPVEKGGIMVTVGKGFAFEEMPHEFPVLILNGWLSVLENLHSYSIRSKSKFAKKLFDESLVLLKDLLPLYDLPDYKNSRYALAGTVPIKLFLPEAAKLIQAEIISPWNSRKKFTLNIPSKKWGISFEKERGGIDGNLVYCIASTISSTRVELSILSNSEGG